MFELRATVARWDKNQCPHTFEVGAPPCRKAPRPVAGVARKRDALRRQKCGAASRVPRAERSMKRRLPRREGLCPRHLSP
jgi:hypothetical protein